MFRLLGERMKREREREGDRQTDKQGRHSRRKMLFAVGRPGRQPLSREWTGQGNGWMDGPWTDGWPEQRSHART